MPIESASDRAVFFNPEEFGTEITWAGVGEPIPALFQNGTVNIATGDGPDFQTREVSLVVSEADLPPGAATENAVTVDGTAYLVRSIAPDGTGMALVRLEINDA